MSCPNLDDLLQAQASPGEAPHVRAHLDAGCTRCAARWEWIERVLQSLRSGPLPRVPERLIHRILIANVLLVTVLPIRPRSRRFSTGIYLNVISAQDITRR